uniref:RalBP1-associated Eps domain-containing protein 1 n=1 Tax=Rhabditophanes sp. KR3021 TaxID=114890 RepID=A0AC35UHQ2_9BILA
MPSWNGTIDCCAKKENVSLVMNEENGVEKPYLKEESHASSSSWTQFEEPTNKRITKKKDYASSTDSDRSIQDDSDVTARKKLFESTDNDGDDDESTTSSETSSVAGVESETERRNLLEEGDSDYEDVIDLGFTNSNGPTSPPPSLATPRPCPSPTKFRIDDDQQSYYNKCFLHLQAVCYGSKKKPSLDGAVNGNDEKVMAFFEKSKLHPDDLSRIWLLSDVNEDGYLNVEEFSMAMHLIVLKVKGGVPIPLSLPQEVRPIEEEPRDGESCGSGSLTSSTTCASHLESSGSIEKKVWKMFGEEDVVDGKTPSDKDTQKSCTNSHYEEDVSATSNPVGYFSKTPPIIVDSQPKAIKSESCLPGANGFSQSDSFFDGNAKDAISFNETGLSNSVLNTPIPPPRVDTSKGHGRSASLDTNTLTGMLLANGSIPNKLGTLPMNFKPNALKKTNLLHTLNCTAPTSKEKPVMVRKENDRGVVMEEELSQSIGEMSMDGNNYFLKADIGCQTDFKNEDSRISAIVKEIEAILAKSDGKDKNTPTLSSVPDPNALTAKERCHILRKLNWQLENERATLAQVKFQLELRLEEYEREIQPTEAVSRPPTKL